MTRSHFVGGSNDNRSVQVDAQRAANMVAERAATAGMSLLLIDAECSQRTRRVYDNILGAGRLTSRDKCGRRR